MANLYNYRYDKTHVQYIVVLVLISGSGISFLYKDGGALAQGFSGSSVPRTVCLPFCCVSLALLLTSCVLHGSQTLKI
jgi:hypothetical protein